MRLLRILSCLLAASLVAEVAAAPLTSRFTYQGVLEQSGAPANGQFDFSFQPFDALSAGSPLASPITLEDIVVDDGVFSAAVDFGEGFFVGDEVFLAIGVRPGASTGGFTTLAPRQPVTATPYALTALGLVESGTGQASLLGRIGFSQTTISGSADSPSVTIGGDGFPIVSYYDPANGDLRVLHCEDPACRSSTSTTVDSGGIVGEFSSIAILRTGLPAISYYDRTGGNLKIAYCLTRSCSSWSLDIVDSGGNVGQYTTLIAGGLFAPALIFYHDVTNGDLKSAECSLSGCATPTFFVVDSVGNVGQFSSAAVGHATGDTARVWVAYYAPDTASVKLAGCSTFGCSGTLLAPVTVESGVTALTSVGLTVGGDGRAWIGYNNAGVVRVARCNSPTACTAPVIVNAGNVNGYTAMSTGIDGVVWYAGRASTGRARAGRCTGLDTCSGASAWTLTGSDTAQPSPVALTRGVDGSMVVAATYGTSMRIFHCTSPQLCTEAGWPR
ncbi:MAG: hypothetical protein IPF61_09075 [Xanthomonadales bacterium]|nr:hypothetical protein [Xanthomonadales bacterium]